MTPVMAQTRPLGRRHHHRLPMGRPTTSDLALRAQPRPAAHLHSPFALEQLTALARDCLEPEFVMLLAPVFGLDLSPQVYARLRAALLQGRLASPACQIVQNGFYPAEYDPQTRTLLIHLAALEHVRANPQRTWELLEILLHEFGHYLDTVLREDLAEPLVRRDASGEEGVRYAERLASAGWNTQQPTLLARYTDLQGETVELYVEAPAALRRILRDHRSLGIRPSGTLHRHRERFEATDHHDGHFSHQRLEQGLLTLGFSEMEREQVYFGNWLRDYSQLLDPKLVRGPRMAKAFPTLLSREALTDIVDILASRQFAEQRLKDREAFRVTDARLGVYRPTEHIDNPRVEPPVPFDPAERDRDFEPWVLPEDETLQVDPQTSMKRYIQRSVDYLQEQLRVAMQAGRNSDGLHAFGAALHVLEDLFAHSNFVELALNKLGHAVLPWTSPAQCRHGLPLVTGRFAGADVIASLAPPVARLVAPAQNWAFTLAQPGQRSDNELMLLVLLREHPDPRYLKDYSRWLEFCDEVRASKLYPLVKFKAWAEAAPLRLLNNAWNEVQRGLLTLLGNQVDEAQIFLEGDPNRNGSTDPTHSQLAKDHGDHPLHEAAALLAERAVMRVAQAMLAHWNGQPEEDPLALAASYFAHPQDTDWQDELLAEWALANPARVEQASSLSDLKKLQDQALQHSLGALQHLAEETQATWHYLQRTFESWLAQWPDFKESELWKWLGDRLDGAEPPPQGLEP